MQNPSHLEYEGLPLWKILSIMQSRTARLEWLVVGLAIAQIVTLCALAWRLIVGAAL